MSIQLEYHHFTVEQYYKMMDIGILKPSDRVELINGDIVKMSPIKSLHAGIVNLLGENLFEAVRKKAIVCIQNPLSIDKYSEPEPDIVIAKMTKDRYRSNHPCPDDVLLLIEVADTTLVKDQTVKLGLYAEAKVKEYWIINIPEKQIEIYRSPYGKKYKEKSILKIGDVANASIIEFQQDVNELF